MDSNILCLRGLLNESHHTIAVTGAGTSVSAGIMAFAGINLPTILKITSTTVLKTAPGHYYNVVQKAFLMPMFENGPAHAYQKLAALENWNCSGGSSSRISIVSIRWQTADEV